MDVYLYTTPDTPVGAVSDSFLNIHTLRRMKFLNDRSVVWCNADAPEIGMWVLAERSTYVSVFHTLYAGWIRATRSQLRWGKNARATLHDSAINVLDLRHIPGDVRPATAVIMHRDKSESISVVGDSNVQRPDSRGGFDFDPFYIIDAATWKPAEVPKQPSPYECAHAMMHGTELLTATCTEEGAAFVRDNIEAFKTTYDDKAESFLSKGITAIDQYSSLQQKIIASAVSKVDSGNQWRAAAAPVGSASR